MRRIALVGSHRSQTDLQHSQHSISLLETKENRPPKEVGTQVSSLLHLVTSLILKQLIKPILCLITNVFVILRPTFSLDTIKGKRI